VRREAWQTWSGLGEVRGHLRFEQLGSAAEQDAVGAVSTGTPGAAGNAAPSATDAGRGPNDPAPGAPKPIASGAASLAGGPPVPSSPYTVLPGQRSRANSLDIATRPPAGTGVRQGIASPAFPGTEAPANVGSDTAHISVAASAMPAAPAMSVVSAVSAASAGGAPTAEAEAGSEAPAAPAGPGIRKSDGGDGWPEPRRQIAIFVRVLCALIVAVLLGHLYLPDVMGLGSLLDTFLPWSFIPLAVLLPASLVSRSKWAIGAAVLAAAVWGVDFGPQFASSPPGGPHDLRILSQNVSAKDPDLAGVAALAVAQNADIVVLQGMSTADLEAADKAVPAAYPHHVTMYEFAVWSKFPLLQSQPIELAAERGDAVTAVDAPSSGQFGGLLKVKVQVGPDRQATLYAVHLPQPSLSHSGFATKRAEALTMLAGQIRAEYDKDLIVVGDLDLAQTDRGMRKLVGSDSGTGLVSAQAAAGSGFGFTWPASFPMVRLDDVLARGVAPVRSVVLGALGPSSAHRPIEVDLRF
jgi:vancomycin resistance protein VanJ